MSASTKKSGDTYDAFAKVVGGLMAKISSNISSTKSLQMGGTATPVSELTGDMQDYVTQNTAVDESKAATANLVAERKVAKVAMEAKIKQFTTWMLANYGDAGYALFGLTPPKPRKTTPQSSAAGVEKRQVLVQAKAAAKKAAAPKGESMVLYDAQGNVIGATQPPSSATPVPAVTPSVPVVAAK